MEVDPRVLLGKVACNTDARAGKRLRGGVHHHDSHGSVGVAAGHERGREDVVIGDECRSGCGNELRGKGTSAN